MGIDSYLVNGSYEGMAAGERRGEGAVNMESRCARAGLSFSSMMRFRSMM